MTDSIVNFSVEPNSTQYFFYNIRSKLNLSSVFKFSRVLASHANDPAATILILDVTKSFSKELLSRNYLLLLTLIGGIILENVDRDKSNDHASITMQLKRQST